MPAKAILHFFLFRLMKMKKRKKMSKRQQKQCQGKLGIRSLIKSKLGLVSFTISSNGERSPSGICYIDDSCAGFLTVVMSKNTSQISQLSSGVAGLHPAPFIPLSVLLLQDPLPDSVAQHLHQQAEEEREAGKPKRTRPSDRQQTWCFIE